MLPAVGSHINQRQRKVFDGRSLGSEIHPNLHIITHTQILAVRHHQLAGDFADAVFVPDAAYTGEGCPLVDHIHSSGAHGVGPSDLLIFSGDLFAHGAVGIISPARISGGRSPIG